MSRILPITASQRLIGLATALAVHGAIGLALLRGLERPESAPAAASSAPVSARLIAPPAPPPAAEARPAPARAEPAAPAPRPRPAPAPARKAAPPPVASPTAAAPAASAQAAAAAAPAASPATPAKAPVLSPPRSDPTHPVTQPPYPPTSRRLQEQGVVTLELQVLADGSVGGVRIHTSSGHARLDQAAAQEARQRWRFLPATRDGVPEAASMLINVRFQLK